MNTNTPPSGSYLSAIRDSCKALREASGVSVETTSIERLLLSPAFTSSFLRVSKSHGLGMPLNFPNEHAELNLLSVLSLLNFAHGYRTLLHQQAGRGAWDSIRALVFAMYISAGDGMLTATGMSAITAQTVAELMGLNTHVERPHDSIPGLTVGELGGEGYQLAKMIADVLTETGDVLSKAGYRDLGSFVSEALREGQKSAKARGEDGVDTEVVLERIVRAIPAFRDMAVVNGQPVYCFKKALFLIHAIAVRFSSSAPFPIPETSNLPVFTDNVIPSMLVHLGVIDLSTSTPSLGLQTLFAGPPDADRTKLKSLLAAAPLSESGTKKSKIAPPPEGPALSADQAYVLRAAAIDACELIVSVAHSLSTPAPDPITPETEAVAAASDQTDAIKEDLSWIKSITLPDLDMWLWAVAKDRQDYRQLDRFVLKETVYF